MEAPGKALWLSDRSLFKAQLVHILVESVVLLPFYKLCIVVFVSHHLRPIDRSGGRFRSVTFDLDFFPVVLLG